MFTCHASEQNEQNTVLGELNAFMINVQPVHSYGGHTMSLVAQGLMM